MIFLDNINETQNRYYYKASSRRKQKDLQSMIDHNLISSEFLNYYVELMK